MEKTYRVLHILVAQRFEAEDILRKLKEGASFEKLAKQFSQCPSREQGGDLGELAFGRADHDFEDAVHGLKIGQITSQPIRTRFGYHLIFRKA